MYVAHISFASNCQQAGRFLKDLLDSEADGHRNVGSGSRVAVATPDVGDTREMSRIATTRGKQPPGVAVFACASQLYSVHIASKERVLHKSTHTKS